LIDESLDLHIWMFSNIVKSTGVRPVVIITEPFVKYLLPLIRFIALSIFHKIWIKI